ELVLALARLVAADLAPLADVARADVGDVLGVVLAKAQEVALVHSIPDRGELARGREREVRLAEGLLRRLVELLVELGEVLRARVALEDVELGDRVLVSADAAQALLGARLERDREDAAAEAAVDMQRLLGLRLGIVLLRERGVG